MMNSILTPKHLHEDRTFWLRLRAHCTSYSCAFVALWNHFEFVENLIELIQSIIQYDYKPPQYTGKSKRNMLLVWSCTACMTNWHWIEKTNVKTSPKVIAYQMAQPDWMVNSMWMNPYFQYKCHKWQNWRPQQMTIDCNRYNINKIWWIYDTFAQSIDTYWLCLCDHLDAAFSIQKKTKIENVKWKGKSVWKIKHLSKNKWLVYLLLFDQQSFVIWCVAFWQWSHCCQCIKTCPTLDSFPQQPSSYAMQS